MEQKFRRSGVQYSATKLQRITKDNVPLLIPIGELTHMFDVWIWMEGTPNQVMRGDVEDEESHHVRVREADVSYPILVSRLVLDVEDDIYDEIRLKGGAYDVLDGIHRLFKQRQQGATDVKVVIASKEQILASKIND